MHSSRVYEHLNKGGGPGEECDAIKTYTQRKPQKNKAHPAL